MQENGSSAYIFNLNMALVRPIFPCQAAQWHQLEMGRKLEFPCYRPDTENEQTYMESLGLV